MNSLDFLDDLEAGEVFEPEMTEQQRKNLYNLIETSTLNPDQKDVYHRFIAAGITFSEAECLKQELVEVQKDLVTLAGEGKLTENGPYGLKVANREWCKRPNT